MLSYGIVFDVNEEIYHNGGLGRDVIILTNTRLIVVDTCCYDLKKFEVFQPKAIWEISLNEIDRIAVDCLNKYIKVRSKRGKRKSIDLGVHWSRSSGSYPSRLDEPFKKALSESEANVDQLESEFASDGFIKVILPAVIIMMMVIFVAQIFN